MDEWINIMHQFTNLSQKEFNFHIDIFFLHKIDYYQLKECHLKGTIIGHIPNETVKVCKNKAEKVLHRFLKRWPDATKNDWKSVAKGDLTSKKKVLAQSEKASEKGGWRGQSNGQTDGRQRLRLHQTGSTGPGHRFNRFQPGGFLVNTSRTEVQLRSSAGLPSWTRKFSWSNQLSLEWILK